MGVPAFAPPQSDEFRPYWDAIGQGRLCSPPAPGATGRGGIPWPTCCATRERYVWIYVRPR